MSIATRTVVLRGPSGEAIVVDQFPAVLGRTPAAGPSDGTFDLSALDPAKKMSRRHAQLWWDGERLLVTDLGSSNGTRVDGFAVTSGAAAVVANGSRVELGPVTLKLEIGGSDTSSTVMDPPPAAAVQAPVARVDSAEVLRTIREESAQRMVDRVSQRGGDWRHEPWDQFFALMADPAVEGGEMTVGQLSRVRRAGAWAHVGDPLSAELFFRMWTNIAERMGIDPTLGGSVAGILDGTTAIQAFLPPLAAVPQLSVERLVSPLTLTSFCDGAIEPTETLTQALRSRRGILLWGDDRRLLAQAADALLSGVSDDERVAVVERRPTLPVRGHSTRLLDSDMSDAAISAGLGVVPSTLALIDAEPGTLRAVEQRFQGLVSPRLLVGVRTAVAPPPSALWPIRLQVTRAAVGTARLGQIEVVPPTT